MLRRAGTAAIALLGAACTATGLALIATLTPGGLTLGLSMLALAALLSLLWTLLRTLWQVRELLMLQVALERQPNHDDQNSLPAAGAASPADSLGLHADA